VSAKPGENMNSIFNILEGFEKLAYKLLIWLILLPKTLVKIILNPSFAPDYIHQELDRDRESPFDEYMPPVLLLLIITLVPALSAYYIPTFEVKLVSPTQDSSIYTRQVEFLAEARFRADTYSNFTEFHWIIIHCGKPVERFTECASSEYLYAESHNDILGDFILNKEDFGEFPNLNDNRIADSSGFQTINRNTVTNSFYYKFEPGFYLIYVVAHSGYDSDGETFGDFVFVNFPEDLDQAVQIYHSGIDNLSIPARKIRFRDPFYGLNEQQEQSWVERIESGEATLLGLTFLSFPLIFALGINFFRTGGRKVSEKSLKESFYAQCYYFAPVGLTFWAWFYTDRYFVYPKDIKMFFQVLFALPLFTAVTWFIMSETGAIRLELQTKKSKAFLVLLFCISIISGITYLYSVFTDNLDTLRNSAICAYPGLCGVLVFTALITRIRKRVMISQREPTKIKLDNVEPPASNTDKQ
jgi:hypothetical protein